MTTTTTEPVVVAVAGLALGGGCELLMHAARRVASIESYIGLVEVGVGLIPGGGGLKEIAVRAKQQGIEQVAFDRSGFKYHGRVKALADAAREAGLQF